jgi:predicted PurR-regulated permease PerM
VIAIGTGLAIIPIYLFFMLESRRSLVLDIREQLSFIREDWREDIIFLAKEFVDSVVSFFRGQIIIAFIMGVLLAIGFVLIGLNFAILLGLAIGFLNIIPYLGSIIGLSIALPLAYFQKDGGGIDLLLFSVGVFVVVQMIEGYLLTPRIMGKTTGLHPMVIIIAIFFWGTALNGLLGMILAIPLTAFFVVAWRLAKRKYLDRLRTRA